MRLSQLNNEYHGVFDPEIEGLTEDSRRVEEGWLFAAFPGTKVDGRRFVEEALRNGAVAILSDRRLDIPAGAEIAVLESANPRRTLAQMAAKFYNRQPRQIVAITGTNGKTSTAWFTQQLWEALGLRAASLGTLGIRGLEIEALRTAKLAAMTTPDMVSLMAMLADIAVSGVDHLAMEASSHGLSQYRLDGVHVRAAAFTNLTRDHLDYHPDMNDYFSAKARLFSEVLRDDGVAVLNADVPEFAPLAKICAERNIRVLDYGRNAAALKLVTRTAAAQGQDLVIAIAGREYQVTLPLVGEFMVMNALAALGLVLAEQPERVGDLVQALGTLKGAPGRLQFVPGHKDAAVYVDYAHTPDALENILKSLRPHTHGKLYCVVGCGGDRDPGKRPIMGRLAATLADVAVITDDNPRSENPATIRAAMMQDAPGAIEIGDRRAAITWAVEQLNTGDVLVIAGKGHEQGQIIAGRVEPFDDVEEATRAIQNLI
ncbi:MAG TPA: UDP-N-acetylmuramoyl-L-alanyl-D-glutamate--2,6-diaminopimelate ligase [Micavibrio sp.]